jgi:dTDP-4-dehydrorhamnose 3,5-epimerase
MEFERLSIPGVFLIKPKIFTDERGFFFESFKAATFKKETGVDLDFVQDNHSQSVRGVLRGLHYQLPPYAQGKLVSVAHGEVFDIALDIRRSSPTFGKYVGVKLSDKNHHRLWIPPGFAHGFVTLSEKADFIYKTTEIYHPGSERSIRYDDPTINIHWQFEGKLLLDQKDLEAPSFLEAEYFD